MGVRHRLAASFHAAMRLATDVPAVVTYMSCTPVVPLVRQSRICRAQTREVRPSMQCGANLSCNEWVACKMASWYRYHLHTIPGLSRSSVLSEGRKALYGMECALGKLAA
jgi:hypothetical protein